MPLDPQIKPLVDLVNAGAAAAPPIWEQTVTERREAYHKLLDALPAGPPVHHVVDRTIPGPDTDIPVRVYTPENAVGIVVFYHGGGWTIGDLDTHDEPCREIANQSGAVVVSVDYRLAPEAKFPAAVIDSFAALKWVDSHKAELAAEDAKIVVSGDSAGGNLAAVMCLLARGLNGPEIAAQLLVYPGTDMRMSEFDSLEANGEGYVLTRETMRWFGAQYLDNPEQAEDWRASPLLAHSLEGLPPALVITAEFDPLRDEGTAYVAALRAAGVQVTHTNYDGMVHIFFQLGPLITAGAEAVAEVAAAAKSAVR